MVNALDMTEMSDSVTKLGQQQSPNGRTIPYAVKVKREKIDTEIEAKLESLNAKPKAESVTPPTDNSDESNDSSSQDDKKQVVPVKSSNEILAELFGVFNAAPPEELLDDKNLLKKHKKSKKEKKKSRSFKTDKSDGECSESDAASIDGKHRHKSKRKKHKHKHKESRDKHKDKDREKVVHATKADDGRNESRKRHAATDSDTLAVPVKKEKDHSIEDRERDKDRERERERDRDREREREKERERERDKEREKERERDRQRDRDKEREREKDRERDRERAHNSFYNGSQQDAVGRDRPKDVSSMKLKTERRESDDLSLSDEETYLREKDDGRRRYYGEENAREPSRDFGRSKPEATDTKRQNNTNTRYQNSSSSARQRTRSPSRSRELGIDKKRLLEIARRNAISMFKRGNMPGVSEMTPEVKDKVLLKMRYGGRTVQDLTDFCKKISNGEMLSDVSSDEDSDVDKNGNAKAFHHPFQLKEREPIVMHIRNATPIVPSVRREEQTKAITMQFPVSSGQVHRMSEVWVPVEKKESLTPLPNLPPAKQATNIFKDVQRNVFAKTIPQQEQQEPAFKAANPPVDGKSPNEQCNIPMLVPPPEIPPQIQKVITAPPPAACAPSVAKPPPLPISTAAIRPPMAFVPEVPIPSTALPPQPPHSVSIFPQAASSNLDVSSIITQRLSAIRRLQDNPSDSEALKMMYSAQRDMTSWVSSKHLPGQFTGSTGAQVMKVHELNSGPQLWARPDQLTSTKPMTGGMGMTLLQKMGWKPGEGLGRTKTGSLQPLQLTVKLDKRGLVSRDDIKQQPPRQPNSSRGNKNSNAMNMAQAALTAQDKHPVCVLNELTSKNRWNPPQYLLKEESGPSHSRVFHFSVEINGQTYTPLQGCNSKKEAKLNAAKVCLRALGILPPS